MVGGVGGLLGALLAGATTVAVVSRKSNEALRLMLSLALSSRGTTLLSPL